MTLRTDLKLLDEANRIVRVHGGAKSVQILIGTDDFLNRKSVRNIPQKQEIAEKALSLLRRDTTVFWTPEVQQPCLPAVFRISPI